MPGVAKLDRRIMRVWRICILLVAVPAGLFIGGAGWLLFSEQRPLVLAAAGAVLVGGSLLAGLAPPRIWEHWSFELAPDALKLAHGAVFHQESVVPWSRVQHVDIDSGPLDRMNGLASLKIHTASASSDAKLPGLSSEEAEELRVEILSRYQGATAKPAGGARAANGPRRRA